MTDERVDLGEAEHLARLCSQSYRTAPEVDGYEGIETVTYSTDDATLFWRPGRLVVAFRGTESANVMEWFYNLTFRPERWGMFGVHVHRGFLVHFRGLWSKLSMTATWRRHCEREDPDEVIYTGHSRGGAIAQLAGLYNQPDLVCTFGGPRVGGRSWRRLCRSKRIRTWRVVNTFDVVPHLPPGLWFRHYGRSYRASITGTHRIDDYVEALS